MYVWMDGWMDVWVNSRWDVGLDAIAGHTLTFHFIKQQPPPY